MRITISLLILLLPALLFADQLYGIINGKAYHFDRVRNYNEKNWGYGFEYNFEQRGRWIPLLTGSSFKDSKNQTSNYLGGGAKKRFMLGSGDTGLHIDLGIVGFVMTRKDYRSDRPFVGALPFISVGNEYIAVNATYIPRISPKYARLLYFQLMIKIAEF